MLLMWRGSVLTAALVIAVFGQAPTEPTRHDKYRDDPKAYCLPGHPDNAHGHECHCQLMCHHVDGDDYVAGEDSACEMYCSASRCACHPDETCGPPPPI